MPITMRCGKRCWSNNIRFYSVSFWNNLNIQTRDKGLGGYGVGVCGPNSSEVKLLRSLTRERTLTRPRLAIPGEVTTRAKERWCPPGTRGLGPRWLPLVRFSLGTQPQAIPQIPKYWWSRMPLPSLDLYREDEISPRIALRVPSPDFLVISSVFF